MNQNLAFSGQKGGNFTETAAVVRSSWIKDRASLRICVRFASESAIIVKLIRQWRIFGGGHPLQRRIFFSGGHL